jgi:hypothetical protein
MALIHQISINKYIWIARFLQQVQAGSQNRTGFLKFFTFITGFSQIWLNIFVDDHQIGYINKIGKKRKKKKPGGWYYQRTSYPTTGRSSRWPVRPPNVGWAKRATNARHSHTTCVVTSISSSSVSRFFVFVWMPWRDSVDFRSFCFSVSHFLWSNLSYIFTLTKYTYKTQHFCSLFASHNTQVIRWFRLLVEFRYNCLWCRDTRRLVVEIGYCLWCRDTRRLVVAISGSLDDEDWTYFCSIVSLQPILRYFCDWCCMEYYSAWFILLYDNRRLA